MISKTHLITPVAIGLGLSLAISFFGQPAPAPPVELHIERPPCRLLQITEVRIVDPDEIAAPTTRRDPFQPGAQALQARAARVNERDPFQPGHLAAETPPPVEAQAPELEPCPSQGPRDPFRRCQTGAR